MSRTLLLRLEQRSGREQAGETARNAEHADEGAGNYLAPGANLCILGCADMRRMWYVERDGDYNFSMSILFLVSSHSGSLARELGAAGASRLGLHTPAGLSVSRMGIGRAERQHNRRRHPWRGGRPSADLAKRAAMWAAFKRSCTRSGNRCRRPPQSELYYVAPRDNSFSRYILDSSSKHQRAERTAEGCG